MISLGLASPAVWGRSQALKEVFAATAVGKVWGVGCRIDEQLEEGGITTVHRLDAATVRRRFSVVLGKTVHELQRTPCIRIDDELRPKQQTMVSRFFGRPVTGGVDVAGPVGEFASLAAEKLRSQQSAAGAIAVFIRTSPSRADDPQCSASVTVPLLRPTGDSALPVSAAIAGLRGIYKTGFNHAKAGVLLVELQS